MQIQADLGDIVGSDPDHKDKASIAINTVNFLLVEGLTFRL